MNTMKQKLLMAAIDEAIENEVNAQKEYLSKTETFNIPVFKTLAKVEKAHEEMLRNLRTKVLEKMDKPKDAKE